jgi:phage shock protein PspC (stress-responsive transcriptional regulator)
MGDVCMLTLSLFAPTDGLYTKRFTHKHPLGRPKSLISESEKAERRAEKAARAFTLATAAALEAQKKERAEKKGGVIGGVARRWGNRKKRNTVIFVLFIVLVLGPLVGALLWAMVVHKFDWTPGAGEGY